jgi:hypothetical protein
MSQKKRSLKIGLALEFENADLRRYLADGGLVDLESIKRQIVRKS